MHLYPILDIQPELRFRPPLGSSLADNRRYFTDNYGHIPVWSESYTRRAGDDHGYGTEVVVYRYYLEPIGIEYEL